MLYQLQFRFALPLVQFDPRACVPNGCRDLLGLPVYRSLGLGLYRHLFYRLLFTLGVAVRRSVLRRVLLAALLVGAGSLLLPVN